MRDLYLQTVAVQNIAPQDLAFGASAVNGASFDAGAIGAHDVVFLLEAGNWTTDAVITFDIEEADDDGAGAPDTWASVAAGDLRGTIATVAGVADENETQVIGYAGSKQWLRVTATPSGTSGSALVAATILAGDLSKARVV